jgi:DNA-binding NarL/FixJ family response regulator
MKAAAEIRRSHPRTAVLVLSQHVEPRHAVELLGTGAGFGYLLKDRVLDVDEFLDAAQRTKAIAVSSRCLHTWAPQLANARLAGAAK